jgi:Icc-related predicted phosphoesterase/uncharacterized protein YprB with RNaseH-like and TPR domain
LREAPRPIPKRKPLQLARSARPKHLKILAISDVHTQDIKPLLKYFENLAAKPDLIIYAGDGLARFNPPEGPNYFELFAKKSQYGLVAVAGNDDGEDGWRYISGDRVYDVHRRPVLVGDILIVGQEGIPKRPDLLPLGAPRYTEPEIARHLSAALGLRRRGPVFVISHAPPHSVLDRAIRFGDNHIGSRALKKIIQQHSRIELVVCGHCHRGGGKHELVNRAVVINAASHDGPDDLIRVASYFWCRNRVPSVEVGLFVHFDEVKPWGELMTIRGIWRTDCPKLWKAGIKTVDQLANLTPDELSAIVGRTPYAVRRFPILARSIVQSKPVAMENLDLPQAPRVFFDIETDPNGGGQLCWLISVLDEQTGGFHQLLACTPNEEKRILQGFVDLCEMYKDREFVYYSGSDFDRRNLTLRFLACRIPIPDSLWRAVDLIYAIRRSLALPLDSYDLKSVATFLEFAFRWPNLDGVSVALEYMGLASAGKPIPRRLLEYNEDDVRSLQHVIHKAEALCGHLAPPTRKERRPKSSRRAKMHSAIKDDAGNFRNALMWGAKLWH